MVRLCGVGQAALVLGEAAAPAWKAVAAGLALAVSPSVPDRRVTPTSPHPLPDFHAAPRARHAMATRMALPTTAKRAWQCGDHAADS